MKDTEMGALGVEYERLPATTLYRYSVTAYRIVRFYMNRPGQSRTIKRGLTLDEAQAHCNDPETSSSTCTKPSGKARTRQMGPWFDGYTEAR